MSAGDRPPHYARVRAQLDALDAPVVQLWGWPGTGKRAILAALLADEPDALYLPAAWLASPRRLEERLQRPEGRPAGLLVCEDQGDSSALAAVAALLAPGQRLLVAGERRLEIGRSSLATHPERLLLRVDEIRKLWRSASGRSLTSSEAERLREHSDGWYLPLSMWARDPAISISRLDDEPGAAVEAVAFFLRERVLAPLAPGERELLVELGALGSRSWASFTQGANREGREAVLRSMMERVALPRIEDGRLRLPRLLAGLLAEERARVRDAGGGGDAARGAPAADPASAEPLRAPSARAHAGRREPAAGSDASAGDAGPELPPGGAARAAPLASTTRRGQADRPGESPDVRIVLLGVPRVERLVAGGLEPVAWTFKRPLRILAYLASAPDLQATREEIVSILWPEADEDAIRRNLHPAVSWLRRSVWPGAGKGGVVLLRDGVYSLDPSLRWEVDVRVFLERVEEGARHLARGRIEESEASWEAAWRLYHGAFLQGWSDRWVLAQREELQLRFTDLLRKLGDLKARLGRLIEAEDAYRTLLLEDPLEEGVHVSIMRIYAARGRRDLVNRQYQRLRSVLLTELGVEPSPPTLDVFNELMR